MVYTCGYRSPLGDILMAADENGLTGLWFEGQKYFADTLPDEQVSQETPVLTKAKRWLDIYFSGDEPDFTPPLHPSGSSFRQEVWKILLEIPYGQTVTYGEIARRMGELKNILIKYYPAESSNELNSVLFDIFTCEEDLASHNYIEDALFIPAIKKLEQERSKNV